MQETKARTGGEITTEKGITEAATKKKRGRPANPMLEVFRVSYPEREKRAAQNLYYVCAAVIEILKQKPGSFFVTGKGNFRRNGIAEQIGRMYEQNGYSEEDCKTIAEQAQELYKAGFSVKAIEKWIRTGRTTGEW